MINNKTKNIALISGLLLAGLPLAVNAQPICPVCTVAVGVGVGLSRWLGVDDVISGVWIGAFLAAITVWINDWLKKKIKNKKLKDYSLPLTGILMYGMTIIPLDWLNIIGGQLNKIWGFDKLLVGITLGTIFLIFGAFLNTYLKVHNNNKVYFPYQKVVIPVSTLIVVSLLIYFFVI